MIREERNISEMLELYSSSYPKKMVADRKELIYRRHIFPYGMLGYRENGKLLGLTTSMISDYVKILSSDEEAEITDCGYITSHDNKSDTLYIIDACVAPKARCRGIGTKLIEAQVELADSLGIRFIAIASRLPDYTANHVPVELYSLWQDLNGKHYDHCVKMLQKLDFHLSTSRENFRKDKESNDNTILMFKQRVM